MKLFVYKPRSVINERLIDERKTHKKYTIRKCEYVEYALIARGVDDIIIRTEIRNRNKTGLKTKRKGEMRKIEIHRWTQDATTGFRSTANSSASNQRLYPTHVRDYGWTEKREDRRPFVPYLQLVVKSTSSIINQITFWYETPAVYRPKRAEFSPLSLPSTLFYSPANVHGKDH